MSLAPCCFKESSNCSCTPVLRASAWIYIRLRSCADENLQWRTCMQSVSLVMVGAPLIWSMYCFSTAWLTTPMRSPCLTTPPTNTSHICRCGTPSASSSGTGAGGLEAAANSRA
eukprot:844689-Pyramimonas_sp.AAC.1